MFSATGDGDRRSQFENNQHAQAEDIIAQAANLVADGRFDVDIVDSLIVVKHRQTNVSAQIRWRFGQFEMASQGRKHGLGQRINPDQLNELMRIRGATGA